MFFKKIEIFGFKSFATKTDVDFLPGVTVVVGPNGCGKSNIFDAIRWALGEKSPKSLRGAKMGDVIFNGSATHKPSAYAQVNLIINNEDRKIGLDYSEINVGRRLYKTGESEYFINKTPCRLKDIMDVFMDTGVGTDSYSVMQQHQVDQIILAKPRERRYIFEEAAGISKYKARKEEALRKLLKTEEDLLRLNDLIAELQKNVNSLKRAAARAERYRQLNNEKVKIDMRYLYLQHSVVDEQLNNVKKDFARNDDRLTEIRTKITLLESQNEEAQLQSEDLTRELSKTQQRLYEIKNAIDNREHQVNLLNERIKNLEERKKGLMAEIQRAEESIKDVDTRKKVIEDEYAGVLEQFMKLEENVVNQEKIYETFKNDYETKIGSLDEKRAEINRRITQKIKLENDLRFAQTMVEKITKEIEESHGDLESLKGEVEKVFAQKNETQQRIAELKEKLSSENEKYDDNRRKISNLEHEEAKAKKTIDDMSIEIRKVQTRLHTLEELQENYQGYYNGVREVMKASDEKRLPGIVGIVAKLISLKKEHEAAIEAAIGGDIQDIVTLTVDQAKSAIEFLRRSDLGRATFLPLDYLKPAEINNPNMSKILAEPGVVGLARNLVGYDPKIQKVIEYLFTDTVVVEDIEVAVNLGKKGYRIKCVSLKGDLHNPRGVLTGGSHKSKGLLSRERELQVTRTELEALYKKEQDLISKWQGIKDNIKQIYKHNEELLASIHRAEIAIAGEKKSFESLTESYTSKKKYLDQLSGSWDRKQQEIAGYNETIELCKMELEEISTQDCDLGEKLKEAESAAENDRNVLQKAQEDLSKLRIDLSSYRERKMSLEDKLDTFSESMNSIKTDCEARKRDITSIDEEKTGIEDEINYIRGEYAELLSERDQITVSISSHTQQQNELTAKLHEVSSSLHLFRREENELANKRNEEQNNITKYETQKENFVLQCEENFKMPLEAVLEKAEAELNEELATLTTEEEKEAATNREQLRNRMYELREQIDRLGNVNPGAIDEYNEQKTRLDFNVTQHADLTEAKESLKKTISQIDDTTSRMFTETFETVRKNFVEMFRKLFNGGKADLILVEEEGQDELGVDIIAQPPGKKLQNIQLLSGGEKALTAIALLFGIFLYKPSPFCILDEIDAPLDDANVIRFTEMVKEFSQTTQFIVITHNKQTMSLADSIYGITMEEPGISKLVSVKFDDIEESQMVVG